MERPQVIGLNYTGVKVVLDLLYADQCHATLFRRLQVIEDEYVMQMKQGD